VLSEPHKLFKLIWQKKKCCDYKSWTYSELINIVEMLQIKKNIDPLIQTFALCQHNCSSRVKLLRSVRIFSHITCSNNKKMKNKSRRDFTSVVPLRRVLGPFLLGRTQTQQRQQVQSALHLHPHPPQRNNNHVIQDSAKLQNLRIWLSRAFIRVHDLQHMLHTFKKTFNIEKKSSIKSDEGLHWLSGKQIVVNTEQMQKTQSLKMLQTRSHWNS